MYGEGVPVENGDSRNIKPNKANRGVKDLAGLALFKLNKLRHANVSTCTCIV